jgi:hypothetical protein
MGTGLDRRFGRIAVPRVTIAAGISKDGGTIHVCEVSKSMWSKSRSAMRHI